jgi:hypothetical protein
MTMKLITKTAQWKVGTFPNRDSIDWARYDDRVALDFIGNPPRFHDTSDLQLLGFDITHPIHAERRSQDSGISWNGGFDDGDALLFTSFLPGPIALVFDQPLRGIRTRIEARDKVNFQATVRAFNGTAPISLPKDGTRTDGDWDGPALQIGFLEEDPLSAPGITRVEFHIQVLSAGYTGNASFAIGRLDLVLE